MNFNFSLSTGQAGYLMTVEKLAVGLNMPEALKTTKTGEQEDIQRLPPYHRRKAFLVDEYPACPDTWMRSNGRMKSYFVPVVEGRGMWLDFNDSLRNVSKDVAIVISVQGVNAVTGLPCKDPQLEQYRDQCPKHKEDFGPDRFCAKCNYKWPKQNYISSTGTPNGNLWLDGFRAVDGIIRQYVLTQQEMRGVASNIIGKDRVFAIGLSFFLSKACRPKPVAPMSRHLGITSLPEEMSFYSSSAHNATYGASINNFSEEKSCGFHESPIASASCGPSGLIGASGPSGDALYDGKLTRKISKSFVRSVTAKASPPTSDVVLCSAGGSSRKRTLEHVSKVDVKTMEIAAGARIDQQVYDDPHTLEHWEKDPEGLIVINYCTEAEAEKIIAAGKVDLTGSPEGFLGKVPVGN